MNALQTERVAT